MTWSALLDPLARLGCTSGAGPPAATTLDPMSQTAHVPIPPDLSRRYAGSSTGRDWLASLPRLIEQSLDRWQLRPDLATGALPWNGHGAIVVPVRHLAGSDAGSDSRAGEPAVLKIAYPHDEALVEPQALALWNGHGAVSYTHLTLPTTERV